MSMFAEALAKSSGAPQAFKKDDQPGKTVTGRITDVDMMDVRSYDDPTKVETWNDGNPKQQVVVTLDTDLRDEGADDDGRRRIYIKWWGEQKKALVAAVRAAGDADLRRGGTFKATFTGLGTTDNPRFNPPKLYQYEYTPPASGLAAAMAAQPTPPAAPTQQPPTSAAQAGQQGWMATIPDDKKTQAISLISVGLDDQKIGDALGLPAADIAVIRTQQNGGGELI